ncbi:hypothetical protein [Mycolicibacterium sp. CH28]|nr:hypothetical protein [Mycolicibacterium sp. CH28]
MVSTPEIEAAGAATGATEPTPGRLTTRAADVTAAADVLVVDDVVALAE